VAFVGEYVDRARYEALCAGRVQKHGKAYVPTQWAVDVDANAFLADYGFDREKLIWSYVFWWRDGFFVFDLEVTEQPPSPGSGRNRICSISSPVHLPPGMAGQDEEVRAKIEAALTAYESFPLGAVNIVLNSW